MRSKILTLVSLSALLLAFTGCDKGRTVMGPQETNVLGIVKHEPASYQPVGPATFAIKTDELYTRQNFSGNRTSLLWGLITIQDY